MPVLNHVTSNSLLSPPQLLMCRIQSCCQGETKGLITLLRPWKSSFKSLVSLRESEVPYVYRHAHREAAQGSEAGLVSTHANRAAPVYMECLNAFTVTVCTL